MARCSGRPFLEYLAGAKGFKPTLRGILADAWGAMSQRPGFSGADFFSPHFNPQKRHANSAKHLSKDEFLDPERLKEVFGMDLKPHHVRLKAADNTLRNKRDVYADLRAMRGAGPFMAKNFYRALTNYKPRDLKGFSECGPGARAFLCLWHMHPQKLLVQTSSQDSSDFFNGLLQTFIKDFQQILRRRIRACEDEEETRFLKLLEGWL